MGCRGRHRGLWLVTEERRVLVSTSWTGKRLLGMNTVDFLFIFLIISLFMYLFVPLLLSFVTWVYYYSVSLSSSFGIHSKINMDMIQVMPPTTKPFDFSMKWVPTYWVFCLFVILNVLCLGLFISVFGISILVFVSGSHLWGLLWMSCLCFGMPEERGRVL